MDKGIGHKILKILGTSSKYGPHCLSCVLASDNSRFLQFRYPILCGLLLPRLQSFLAAQLGIFRVVTNPFMRICDDDKRVPRSDRSRFHFSRRMIFQLLRSWSTDAMRYDQIFIWSCLAAAARRPCLPTN